ncbi:MAG: hypothetical protein CVV44_16970 [Spirochaetae bacterium HGW-Spirochaetae-1]|jgi:ribosomal protein S18 acetylase RimI-like enzyme|nr:MAG: hypothetical protein CVV44_16970 [Spirochaetae bacterium HGW-Spirochaetae-1]
MGETGLITIRDAELNDIPVLKEMKRRLQEHMEENNKRLWGMSGQYIQNLDAFYQSKIGKGSSRLLLAYDSGKPGAPVGMALGRIIHNEEQVPNKSGRIDDVWVEPEHRRMGICEILVKELIEFFKKNRVFDLVLEYAIYNREAEETWRKMGFSPSIIISTARIDEVKI